MLKINLLPDSARKTTLSPIEQFHRTPLMWLLAGGLVLVALVVSIPIPMRRRQLNRLQATIQDLKPKKQEVEQLQQFLQQLRAQEATFRVLGTGQGSWSKRLNVLSNVTPDGVWFSDLELDETTGLEISGAVIGEGGSEMMKVGRLVQDLKADPDFTSAVKDVQIRSVQRISDKEIEIVEFVLSCSLHAPRQAP